MGKGAGVRSKALGKFIKAKRDAKGWSQTRLAEEIGAHRSYMSQIESGERQWPETYISPLAKALDVTEEDLARVAGRIVATRPAPSAQEGVAAFPAGSTAARVVELMNEMSDWERAEMLHHAELVVRLSQKAQPAPSVRASGEEAG